MAAFLSPQLAAEEAVAERKAAVQAAREKPLFKNGEIGNGRSFDNVKPTTGGNARSYTLRRLARDRPDLLDAD